MSKQNSVRHELQELAGRLTKESYNINAFVRRKSLQTNSTQKLIPRTLSTETGRDEGRNKQRSAEKAAVLTQQRYTRKVAPNSNRNKRKSHITDYNHTNYTQNFITKRNNTNHTDTNQERPPENTTFVRLIDRKEKSVDVSNFHEKEKSTFKNKSLADGHFEDWINQILIQRCPQQRFDKNIVNPALKRFEIDKNSLLSHGISEANASRILKSLFIYSIGFNNLLAEIGNNKAQVQKSLWKVFSILIEYCSEGTFETVVSTIHRDHQSQVEGLKTELENQKEMIEKNELKNKQKNEKVYQENKELRLENERLELDSSMLKQANEEVQRAYSEEIALRLMFERKISDLHRLYRQLELKHHKLFSDFQLKINELAYFKDKSSFYYNENLHLKKEKAALEDELREKVAALKQMEELSGRLRREINEQYSVDTQWRIEKRISDGLLRQKEVREQQMASQLKNNEASLDIHKRTHKGLLEEYYRSLEENNRLIAKLNDQLADITQRLIAQKDLNNSNAQYLSEIHLLNLKLQRKVEILSDMEVKAKQYFEKIEELDLQLQNCSKTIENMQATVASANEVIANLRRVNEELENSMQALERISEKQQESCKAIEEELQAEKKEARTWRHKHESAMLELQKARSKLGLLSEQNGRLQASLASTVSQEQSNSKSTKEKYKKMERELVQKAIEAEKLREANANLDEKYKNEKFERDALDFSYKHALSAFENSNAVIKDKNIQIAELERNLEEQALGYKLVELEMAAVKGKRAAEAEEKERKMAVLEQKLRKKQGFVHPMLYEDIFSRFQQLSDEKARFKDILVTVEEDFKEVNASLRHKLEKMELQARQREAEYSDGLRRKEHEVEYEQRKHRQNLEKIDYLELTLKAKEIYEETHKPADSNKEKEKRYLEIISENYFKLNALAQDLETIENHNHELIERVQFNEAEIDRQFALIGTIEKEKSDLRTANAELLRESRALEELKQELLQEIGEKECLLTSYVPEYRSLRQSPSQKLKRKRESAGGNEKATKLPSFSRKQSLMEPVIVQIKEREEKYEREEPGRPLQQSLLRNEDWRSDFSSKLKSSFGYYS